MTPNQYTQAYYDEEAVFPDNWTVRRIAMGEAVRLSRLSQVCELAADRKRRLGSDATLGELRRDKLVSRRLGHLAKQMQSAWESEVTGQKIIVRKAKPGPSDDWKEVSSLSATVDWPHYAAETVEELRDRARLVVSWALKNGERKFANRAVNRYTVELERTAQIAGVEV